MAEKIGQFVLGALGIGRHRNGLQARSRQDQLRNGWMIREMDGEDVAAPNPEASQKTSCLVNAFQELPEGPSLDLPILSLKSKPWLME